MRHRFATMVDIPLLLPTINEAYRGQGGWTAEGHLVSGPRIDLEDLTHLILDKPNECKVLVFFEDEGRSEGSEALLGCIKLEKMGEDVFLGLFCVSVAKQGKGVGKKMLEAAEKWASKLWGSRHALMTVFRVRPELVAYYLRRGYEHTGHVEPFDYELVQSLGKETPLVADLDLFVLKKILANET
ncbi:acyl-CoA N-acyltransferase [Chytriomyces sp. MP71]|nr:acyl-CoA N-acyltransferase [Chytriomyces sp. MP71]KAI8613202.1 acyl-CoA N-acyltransferase [Chytriomyces sp. MP71]